MGQPCYSIVDLRDGPCHPDLPTLELLDDCELSSLALLPYVSGSRRRWSLIALVDVVIPAVIQGLCDCLIQQQPLLRAAVANELSLFGPGLIETLIPSLVTLVPIDSPICLFPG